MSVAPVAGAFAQALAFLRERINRPERNRRETAVIAQSAILAQLQRLLETLGVGLDVLSRRGAGGSPSGGATEIPVKGGAGVVEIDPAAQGTATEIPVPGQPLPQAAVNVGAASPAWIGSAKKALAPVQEDLSTVAPWLPLLALVPQVRALLRGWFAETYDRRTHEMMALLETRGETRGALDPAQGAWAQGRGLRRVLEGVCERVLGSDVPRAQRLEPFVGPRNDGGFGGGLVGGGFNGIN